MTRQVVASLAIQSQDFSARSHRSAPAHRLRLPAAQASRKMPTLLCHSATESAPPHLDLYRYHSGDGDYPDPTALEAYSK
jgi:hypothetical protein